MDLADPDYDGAIADYETWLNLAETTYTSAGDKTIVQDKLRAATRLRASVRATPRRHRRSSSADTPSPGSLAVMNLYERLGVDPQCSMQDLKAALREALVKHHTDHGGAHGAVRYIYECKEIKNPTRRARYNRLHGFGNWQAD